MINPHFELHTYGDDGREPTLAHDTDLGYDFYSSEEVNIKAHSDAIISTGIHWKPEFDFENYYSNFKSNFDCYDGERSNFLDSFYSFTYLFKTMFKIGLILKSKSGLSCRDNIEVGAGVIDQTYTDEIKVHLYNNSDKDYWIEANDKICQGIIIITPKTTQNILSNENRGNNGFGSTGK
jgi:dUTPase